MKNSTQDKILIKVVDTNEENSVYAYDTDYELVYKKNTIVKAKEGTLGIFCFDTMKNAKEFVEDRPVLQGEVSYKRVKTICEIKECNVKVCYYTDRDTLNDFYNKDFSKIMLIEPPKGTVLCDEVKVLD